MKKWGRVSETEGKRWARLDLFLLCKKEARTGKRGFRERRRKIGFINL